VAAESSTERSSAELGPAVAGGGDGGGVAGDGPAEAYRRFSELVEGLGGQGRWLVLTHDNPDPDALASAAVLARILRGRFKRRVTIAYGGIIGRAENREMVRQLRLSLSHLRHLNWKHYRHVALVDTQPRTGNNQLPAERPADLVIDHHPLRKTTLGALHYDVRPAYGATATIVGEYLLASGLPIDQASATALIYAIRSETLDFRRESPGPDKAIFDALVPHADKARLARIQYPRLPLSYFRTLHQALENLETVDSLIVCHLGEVEQPDIIPEIADLLLRMAGKTWSLCSGVFGDRVFLSIRTTNPRADAGSLMRRLLRRRGKGGGHGMTAGGWVPVAKAPGQTPRLLQRQLAELLAMALHKNPEKLLPLAISQPLWPKGNGQEGIQDNS
jgi:nanoRNase/pAp phosphatase (c-di-AMP/oligoRNAs hydrolase)